MPWRFIDESPSTTTRGRPTRLARSSRSGPCVMVCTRAPSPRRGSAAWMTGRYGSMTSTSPGKPASATGASAYVPTAIIPTPAEPCSRAHSATRRSRPNPYPLPLTTGISPGFAERMAAQVRAPAGRVDVQGQRHGVSRRRPCRRRNALYSSLFSGRSHSPTYSTASPPVPTLNWISPTCGSSAVEGVGDAAQVVDGRRPPRARPASSATGSRSSRGPHAWRSSEAP